VSEQRFAFGQGQADNDERLRAVRATPSMFSSPRGPKKRRSDEIAMISLSAEGVNEMVEWAVDKALLDFASKQTREVRTSSVQSVRDEVKKTFKSMQTHMVQMMNEAVTTLRAEAETKANSMLQPLLDKMSGMILGSVASKDETVNNLKQASTTTVGAQTQGSSQIPEVAKQTWANRFGSVTQVSKDRTTVGRRKNQQAPRRCSRTTPPTKDGYCCSDEALRNNVTRDTSC